MMYLPLLCIFLILDVQSLETCVNTENSVLTYFTPGTGNICPSQSVTARCVVNSTHTPVILIWECESQDGPIERALLCGNANNPVVPLNCEDGEVQLTVVSCTCNDSTITSDATFLATSSSGTLRCTDNSNEIQGFVSFGIEEPLTPVLEHLVVVVEKNRFGNITIEWSSSGNEQYLGSVSSQILDQMNFTTLATMINVILEVGVNYSITVTAERCNGSVKSNTSKSLDIILSVPDAVESCRAVPVYNEMTLDRINLNWTALPDENHVATGVTVDLMGFELMFLLNQTLSTAVPLSVSQLECSDTCHHVQTTLPDAPFTVSVAGENRFGVGQTTLCTWDEISLRNVFLTVTEFNETAISILFEVNQTEINILCGKERSNLKQCATIAGTFDKILHVKALESYTNMFKSDTLYYYEVQTESIIVEGSIISTRPDMASPTDSSLTSGAVAGIVIAPSIIIIVIISLVICVAVLFVRSRSKKSDLTISAGPQENIHGQSSNATTLQDGKTVKESINTTDSTLEESYEMDTQEPKASDRTQYPLVPATAFPTDTPEHPFPCVKENLLNVTKGKEIIGLCVTDKRIYFSDSKTIMGSTEYSVRIFNKASGHEECKIIGFERSRGIATDKNNCIYVSDSVRNRLIKFNEEGEFLLCTRDTVFNKPYGILATDEYIFVCDNTPDCIRILDHHMNLVYDISTQNLLSHPTDIAFDGTSYYVTCKSFIAIIDINFSKKSFWVSTITKMSTCENCESDRNFKSLRGICTHNGYLYVTERQGRVLCLKYEKHPNILTLIGEIANVSPMVIAQYDGEIYYSRKVIDTSRSNYTFEIVKVTHEDFQIL